MDFNSLKNGLSNLTQEEAAPVKAQIKIVKGGHFLTGEEEQKSPLSGFSLSDMGLPSDLMDNTIAEFNELQQSMGLGETDFTGYGNGEIIQVQLNPNSYTIQSKSNFKSEKMGGIKTQEKTIGVFSPPNPRELSVELFYDTMLQADYLDKLKEIGTSVANSLTSANGLMDMGTKLMSVYQKFTSKEDLNKLYLDKLLGLTRILKEIQTPALISFQYGSTAFEGYVDNVSVEYKRFNKMGEVTRAQVHLSIKESNIFGDKDKASGSETKMPTLGSSSSVLENIPL